MECNSLSNPFAICVRSEASHSCGASREMRCDEKRKEKKTINHFTNSHGKEFTKKYKGSARTPHTYYDCWRQPHSGGGSNGGDDDNKCALQMGFFPVRAEEFPRKYDVIKYYPRVSNKLQFGRKKKKQEHHSTENMMEHT